jgi:hypothetical protein
MMEPAGLRQILSEKFSEGDLIGLCVDLQIDYELLPGRHKGEKGQEMILYCQRRGRYEELLAAAQRLRPNLFVQTADTTNESSVRPEIRQPVRPVENPFFVGGRINDPRQFFGRERLVREMRNELKKRASVSLEGESQVGKSSLLYYLYATREEWLPEVTVAYVDLQGVWDEADFCEMVLAQLGQEGDTPRALKRALANRPAVLLFDEMERLAQPDFDPRWHDLLRSLAQEPHIALCLATQRPLVEVFAPRVAGGVSPFHNIFTIKQLGPFSEAEAREFLHRRLQSTDIGFSQEEIDRMVTESGGRPSVLQRLAYGLFEMKRRDD